MLQNTSQQVLNCAKIEILELCETTEASQLICLGLLQKLIHQQFITLHIYCKSFSKISLSVLEKVIFLFAIGLQGATTARLSVVTISQQRTAQKRSDFYSAYK